MVHTPRAVSPIVGLALSPHGSQSPVRVEDYRSASPVRNVGGREGGPVEIGPCPSQNQGGYMAFIVI
jgi:hypothetical protein